MFARAWFEEKKCVILEENYAVNGTNLRILIQIELMHARLGFKYEYYSKAIIVLDVRFLLDEILWETAFFKYG